MRKPYADVAVEDLWLKKDGSRSARYGRGKRYRTRYRDFPARSFRTQQAARDYERELRDRGEGATDPTAEDPLIRDLLTRWLATKEGSSPRGYRANQDAAAHIRRRWGDRKASTIDAEEVQVWVAQMKAEKRRKRGVTEIVPASPSLRHKNLQALSGALGLTKRANPCVGVVVPDEIPRDPWFLDVDDLLALAEQTGDHYRTFTLFLGTVGPRIGEVCALNVGAVDRRRRRVRLKSTQTKSRKPRDLPIPGIVWGGLNLARPRDAPLFVTPSGRRILKDNWRARVFTPSANRAGLEGLHIHDLRHTAVSLAIRAGADVKAVQTMVGHGTGRMTIDLYGHLWDQGLDDVARRMDALLTVPESPQHVSG